MIDFFTKTNIIHYFQISITWLINFINWLNSKMDFFQLLFFGGVFIYCMRNILLYKNDKENYLKNLTYYRKIHYLFCFSVLGLGLILSIVAISDWTVLSMYLGMCIVTDLAVYQTPSIRKFANTEFDTADTVNDMLIKLRSDINKSTVKSKELLSVIQDKTFFGSVKSMRNIQKEDIYSKQLKNCLLKYMIDDTLEFKLYPFNLNNLPDTDSNHNKNIDNVIDKIAMIESVSIDSSKKNSIINGESGIIQEFNNNDGKPNIILIPIFGENLGMLLSLKGYTVISPIEITHISILAYHFDSQVS